MEGGVPRLPCFWPIGARRQQGGGDGSWPVYCHRACPLWMDGRRKGRAAGTGQSGQAQGSPTALALWRHDGPCGGWPRFEQESLRRVDSCRLSGSPVG